MPMPASRSGSGRSPLKATIALAAGLLALPPVGCDKDAGGESPEEKVRQIAAVTNDRPRGGGAALARALDDPSPKVRKAALLGLSQYVTPEHRGAIERACRDGDPHVRAGAATTLSLYRDQASSELLAGLLSADSDEAVRMAAASGLKLNPSQKAIVSLLENAEKNTSPAAQVRAMQAVLSRLGLRSYRNLGPGGGREWRALIEEVKHNKVIREAYAATGTSLVYHPEDKKPDAPGHSP